MAYQKERAAGALFFVGVTQFIIGIVIAEVLHPGYSVSGNYVSDLGIGPYSLVFNSSVFLLGLLALVGSYFLRHNSDLKTVNTLLFLMSLGAMAVGIVTKDYPTAHGVVSSVAFFFSGLAAIASSKLLKMPFSLINIVLGAITISALSLFSIGMVTSGSITSSTAYNSIFYLGLGPGGMERMIIYPALMWLASFSGHLVTQKEQSTT